MPIELRPEVRIFAEAMERKLRANESKGGWEESDCMWLMVRAVEEMGEFSALAFGSKPIVDLPFAYRALVKEAADVSNFLMMICDNLDALDFEEAR